MADSLRSVKSGPPGGLLLREARNILRHRGLNWVLLIVLVLNLIAAAMVLEFEGGNLDANIASYPDALWWAVTTISTVGYGDRFPMSSPGRAVAVVLMIAGIAMFGVITATSAAYFVEQQAGEDTAGWTRSWSGWTASTPGCGPARTSTPVSTSATDPWSLVQNGHHCDPVRPQS
jgi:voltage-gated potassium channel